MHKVFNFGSLNLDYVYAVDHLVRAGETIGAESLTVQLGGKGLNQSIALARAGAKVCHVGCVGTRDGAPLVEALRRAGVDVSRIRYRDVPTGSAVIQVDRSGQNSILIFGGANRALTERDADEAFSTACEGDFLLLQNEINLNEAAMRKAAAAKLRIVLNPSPCDAGISALPLHLVEFLILNELEGADLTGQKSTDGPEILGALRARFPAARLLLTLGERGVLYDDGERVHRHGAFKIRVRDTTAAGDTFTGFFLDGLIRGLAALPRDREEIG